jgi:hypothetical protein
MKKLVQIQEVEGEGLISLMGETVTLFCSIYIYTGKLVGVNSDYVKLEKPKIVYDTGAFDKKDWADAQALPNEVYVRIPAIEMFGKVK